MKILIHSINYAPELTGIGKYTGEMAIWLSSQGHEVRVVSAPPYYPQWRINDGYTNWWGVEKRLEGVTVYRCPLWVPSQPSGLKRLLHLASFAFFSLPVMLRQIFWNPDVVLVIEPPFFCAPQAWLVARLSGAKAWLHIQDFEIDAAFELGILRSAWMKRRVLIFEQICMQQFDRVSTISSKMLDKLSSKELAPEKAVYFPNWVDPHEIFPLAESTYRNTMGFAPNIFVALYSGNMGEKQGLGIVLEAAAELRDNPHIHFVLCGDGAARLRLQNIYGGLPNVIWLPLQPVERLNDLLNLADVHLLPQLHGVTDLVMPSKLLGMLASGRPILTTAAIDTLIGQLVSQCGAITSATDASAFSGALLKLASVPDERLRLGRSGRKIAESQFSKELVLKKFEKELMEICRA